MANIDDLPIESILSMSDEDALEKLRAIRLNRLNKPATKTPRQIKKQKEKAIPKVTPEQAAELLKLLTSIEDN